MPIPKTKFIFDNIKFIEPLKWWQNHKFAYAKNLMKYPGLLSTGSANKVIALSKTEVAKLFVANTRSEIGSEAEKMKFANGVN